MSPCVGNHVHAVLDHADHDPAFLAILAAGVKVITALWVIEDTRCIGEGHAMLAEIVLLFPGVLLELSHSNDKM